MYRAPAVRSYESPAICTYRRCSNTSTTGRSAGGIG